MSKRKASIDPLFDEEPSRGGNIAKYLMISGITIIVGFILYATLSGGNTPQGPLPVIRADITPWTREATETGGMDIPNQDSTVFELMDKKDMEPPALEEQIATEDGLPPEDAAAGVIGEAPVAAEGETAATAPTDAAPAEDVIGDLIDTTATPGDEAVEKAVDEAAANPVEETVETTVDASADKAAKDAADKAKLEAEKVAAAQKALDAEKAKAAKSDADAPYNPNAPKTVTPVAAEVAKPASSGGTVQVRLGSVPGSDKAAAAGEFNRLKGLAGGSLSGASPSYESVTLDGKGSFVRINVSMDRASATKLCDTLSAKGAPCLILGQ